MKRKYTKPSIHFERLSVNNISASCAMKITFAEWECPVLIPEWGETVFQEHNCDWSNDSGYICYHVPTISTNIFDS